MTATIAVTGGTVPRSVDAAALRERLLRDGALLEPLAAGTAGAAVGESAAARS